MLAIFIMPRWAEPRGIQYLYVSMLVSMHVYTDHIMQTYAEQCVRILQNRKYYPLMGVAIDVTAAQTKWRTTLCGLKKKLDVDQIVTPNKGN